MDNQTKLKSETSGYSYQYNFDHALCYRLKRTPFNFQVLIPHRCIFCVTEKMVTSFWQWLLVSEYRSSPSPFNCRIGLKFTKI